MFECESLGQNSSKRKLDLMRDAKKRYKHLEGNKLRLKLDKEPRLR